MDVNQFWEDMAKIKWAEPEKEDTILQNLKRRLENREKDVQKILKDFPANIKKSMQGGYNICTYTFGVGRELEVILFVKALLDLKVPIQSFYDNGCYIYVEIPINALLDKKGVPTLPPTTDVPILDMPKTPLLGAKK